MRLDCVLAPISSRRFSCFQLIAYKSCEQFLGLNQGNLYIAVGISLKKQLLLDRLRKNREYFHSIPRKPLLDKRILFTPIRKRIKRICLAACKKFVDLADQSGELGNKFHNALGNHDNAKVKAVCRSLLHGVCNIIRNLGQGLLLFLNLLGDQTDIRLALQCTLQCNMRSAPSHNLDEMPVFLGRVAVSLNVSNQFAVSLSCRIKTKGNLNVLIL